MPVKTKVDKRKKPKQKQKQKQIVKTNVKVSVQSSGGSGGGGSSMPQPFTDRSGENVRLQNLIEQLARKVNVPVLVPNNMPITEQVRAPVYNPANDATTFKSIFKAPINFDEPISTGGVSQNSNRPTYEDIRGRYVIPPIDTTGMSGDEISQLMGGEFAEEQEFVIQPKPKKGGRTKGSKNKPKFVIAKSESKY